MEAAFQELSDRVKQLEQDRAQKDADIAQLAQELQTAQLQAAQAAAAAQASPMTAQEMLQANKDMLAEFSKAFKNMSRGSSGNKTLIDVRGLGRPPTYDGKEEQRFLPWSVKTRNYVTGVYAELGEVMDWASDLENTLTFEILNQAYGEEADDVDRIEGLKTLDNQLYTVLQSVCEGEPFDIVLNAGQGNGLEAWRRLHKRFDPSTAGRHRNILGAIIRPPRQKLENLSAALEAWEERVARYERKKDEKGNRRVLADDIKVAAVGGMVPEALEEHLVLNGKRLTTYASVREEIQAYLDTKYGIRLKKADSSLTPGQSHLNDAMDIDSFNKGRGKGGKRGKTWFSPKPQNKPKFTGTCNNCGKVGHKKIDCWAPGGGAFDKKGGGNDQHQHQHGKGSFGDRNRKPNDASGGSHSSAARDNKGGKGAWGRRPNSSGKNSGAMRSLEGGGEQPEEECAGADAGCIDCGGLGIDLGSLDVSAIMWTKEGPRTNGRLLTKVTSTIDTGAGVTVIPRHLAENGKCTPANNMWYTTASGERVPDEGGCRMCGVDDYENERAINGRISDVHKVLLSMGQTSKRGMEGWFRDDGGYLWHKNSAIGRSMRRHFNELVNKHGYAGLLPVRLERNVYVFDMWTDDNVDKEADLNPLGQSGPIPGGPRLALP